MNKKNKVLHIIPGFGGGISSHVRNVINNIDSNRVVIDVAGFTEYPKFFLNEIKEKDGNAFVLKNVRINCIYNCMKQYIDILKKNNYDAIHMHLTDIQAAYFSILSRICGINRIIVHAHIADQPNSKSIMFKIKNYIYKKITVLVASDLASCSKISSEFRFGSKYVKKNKVMHIPNSIDINKYITEITVKEKQEYYNEFNIDQNKLIIGHVGYFGYQKNHLFMLEIIKRMKERGIGCVWLFIGIGHDLELIKSKAKEMEILDMIHFLGRRNDVNKIYKIMNVTILPSHYEGLPTVTIETQAAGVPTVISDTITEETEMGLDMITRLSLNESIDCWIDEIIKSSNKTVASTEVRVEKLQENCFTSNRVAELYMKFIKEEIKTYNIGDDFEL